MSHEETKTWTANVFTAALIDSVSPCLFFSTQIDNCEIALPPPKTNMEAENHPIEYLKQSSKPSFFGVPTVSFQGSADENLITFDITSPPTFGIVDKQKLVLLKTTEI